MPGHGDLTVSPNGRFLQYEDGTPFFWQGDTAWLMLARLTREEIQTYLRHRAEQGYNVIQVMLIHGMPQRNIYGFQAFVDGDTAKPNLHPSRDSYWNHVDYAAAVAQEHGLYLALVMVWGSVVKQGFFTEQTAEAYAAFLAERYGDQPNIIWLNGGDIQGTVRPAIWCKLAETVKRTDTRHLMSFHPFGRTRSSQWFHQQSWLDFNMFQSGHRRYDQAGHDDDNPFGPDNWQYVQKDCRMKPVKPTLDGEPSYEDIPQGLHDPKQPYWQADDVRRYAYWSVLAGACGHTYGHNAIMQMHSPGWGRGAYGVRKTWQQALADPGGTQMQHLQRLILSRPFFSRRSAQELLAGDEGAGYARLLAARGDDYALIYNYQGRPFTVTMGCIRGDTVKAWWYQPSTGQAYPIGEYCNRGVQDFRPPGTQRDGNDWVLVLDDSCSAYPAPGGQGPHSSS